MTTDLARARRRRRRTRAAVQSVSVAVVVVSFLVARSAGSWLVVAGPWALTPLQVGLGGGALAVATTFVARSLWTVPDRRRVERPGARALDVVASLAMGVVLAVGPLVLVATALLESPNTTVVVRGDACDVVLREDQRLDEGGLLVYVRQGASAVAHVVDTVPAERFPVRTGRYDVTWRGDDAIVTFDPGTGTPYRGTVDC